MANVINIGGGAGGGSGSNVVPNPQGTATDTLTKIGIDGTVYDFAGGGSGGSGYSETTLWSGSETPSTDGTQITLSDNISNYDEIVFVLDTNYVGTGSFPVSQLTIGENYISTIWAPTNYGVYWSYDSDTTVTIKSLATGYPITYIKVIGIKYGGGSMHNYSTTEQVVGTWVDGKTLYEKTILGTTEQSVPETQVNHGINNLDTVVSIEGSIRCGTQYQTLFEHSRPSNEEFTRISDTVISIVSTDSDWRGKPFHITLRYTKTTDTALKTFTNQ